MILNATDQPLSDACVGIDFPWLPLEVWEHLLIGDDPVVPKTTTVINWGQWWPLTTWEWTLRGREHPNAFTDDRIRPTIDMCFPLSFDAAIGPDGELDRGLDNVGLVEDGGELVHAVEDQENFMKLVAREKMFSRVAVGLPAIDPEAPIEYTDDPPLFGIESLIDILQDSEIDPGVADGSGGGEDPEDPGCGVDEPVVDDPDTDFGSEVPGTGGGR